MEDKKEKLYVTRQIEKWELPPNLKNKVNEFVEDKSTSMKYMLPNETESVKCMGQTFGVINKLFYDNT